MNMAWGQGNHYSRHLKNLFGMNNTKIDYSLPVPAIGKNDLSRTIFQLQVSPPHELLRSDILADPSILERVDRAAGTRALPPVYYSNPVVQASVEWPVPLGLYMDSPPIQQNRFCGGYMAPEHRGQHPPHYSCSAEEDMLSLWL